MPGEEPIVVGVDGSDASMRALRWGLQEARRWSSPVHVVAAWESHAVLGGPAPVLRQPERAPHRLHEEYRQKLIRTVRTCTADLPSPPDLHVELVEGHAAEVLVQHSAHAAMLVLGDHGRGRASEAMLGRTALRCIHKAQCPVLILPAGMGMDTTAEERGSRPATASSVAESRNR
ncbi:nucleotide-binding universal stress UspA family protein [Halopolyspora algeriensis]|uniref:Nucleotide-binding universal stress UspA family protein n=1 Tax=Halopolyspora algeriensis TaxID=1500506 RepID=A0A368VUW7_9ACTN|nr:universal stress protein [Halopolyspora algeriensis]RCW44458.1 nucleotide-binding universal stress UspA family protein [Halopolyspora algeriensis]TQM55819.1 nucleotide-binding universal stress UspA family protein [Halopolyspora algeriensis]